MGPTIDPIYSEMGGPLTDTVAIVLAAGQGKRMRSALPKVLHRIAGRPMIEHVIRAIQDAGMTRIVVVIGHGGDQVRDALPDGVDVAVQAEQRGTADATMAGLTQIGVAARTANVVVCYGDCPLLSGSVFRDLTTARAETGAAIALAVSSVENPRGYGRVLVGEHGNVQSIVEDAVATDEERRVKQINAGVYCFDGDWLSTYLPLVTPSRTGELFLTDLVQMATESGRLVRAVDTSFELTVGVNDRVQLSDADRVIRDRIRRQMMISGVTLVDPQTTYIDVDVSIGVDTIVYPGTILEGQTRIGSGGRIGPRAHIVDSDLGNDVIVDAAVVERSAVGDGARVGPFSHLRPGSRLMPGADLGNFAEVKNATIGAGSKMHHFSYVGDADVGDGVNIGAGTITCNYDGETGLKSRTVVERGASLGSDTMLVAPVRVGEDAITAAGAVVTRDVEASMVVVGVPARPVRARRPRNATAPR